MEKGGFVPKKKEPFNKFIPFFPNNKVKNQGSNFVNPQPRLGECYKCGEKGHYAKDYTKGGCYNYVINGHLAKDCTKPPFCRYRKKEGHIITSCFALA